MRNFWNILYLRHIFILGVGMTQKFFLLTSTIFKSKEMFYYYEFYIILSISRISISFLRLIIYVSVLASQNKKKNGESQNIYNWVSLLQRRLPHSRDRNHISNENTVLVKWRNIATKESRNKKWKFIIFLFLNHTVDTLLPS